MSARQAWARWEAACELVRAQDQLTLMVRLGRSTPADRDRLARANSVWSAAKVVGR